MRENIGLYRGKRIGGGFICGCLIIDKGAKGDQPHAYILQKADYGSFAEFVATEVDPETVGECSGILDRANVFIFEGDMLKITYLCQKPVTAVVEFIDGKFTARYTRNGKEYIDNLTAIASSLYKIIGNIHDNPELLEAANE